MQLLDLYAGRAFRMGKGSNWRIVHPEMGARRLTLNHGLHEPGQEFTQHLHDESEDMIVVLEGGGAVRQGDGLHANRSRRGESSCRWGRCTAPSTTPARRRA